MFKNSAQLLSFLCSLFLLSLALLSPSLLLCTLISFTYLCKYLVCRGKYCKGSLSRESLHQSGSRKSFKKDGEIRVWWENLRDGHWIGVWKRKEVICDGFYLHGVMLDSVSWFLDLVEVDLYIARSYKMCEITSFIRSIYWWFSHVDFVHYHQLDCCPSLLPRQVKLNPEFF